MSSAHCLPMATSACTCGDIVEDVSLVLETMLLTRHLFVKLLRSEYGKISQNNVAWLDMQT